MKSAPELPFVMPHVEPNISYLAHIAIPLPIDDPFTYRIPDSMRDSIQVGMRVRVPFKNRDIVGYVVDILSGEAPQRCKVIEELLDSNPVLPNHFLELSRWIKNYYYSSWGEAIQTVLPKFLRQKKTSRMKRQKKEVSLTPAGIRKDHILNQEQQHIFNQMRLFLIKKIFQEILLFGVTGSGKSELYIRAIKECLNMNRTAICLVPEIALTEQLEHFFEGHFGSELEILHSKLSDGEREAAWERIRRGEKKVVLGARSAIFAPLENLGLIVIDEEHEQSYKQDQTPRYHAREVARWRAKALGCVLVLGSATPSVESMHAADQGLLIKYELTKRVALRAMPEIRVIDLKHEQDRAKGRVIISDSLRQAVEQTLDRKEGVLLLLNRRGFSTQVHCLKCSKPISCRFCDVALTFHQEANEFLCHYCNFHISETDSCPQCKSPLLKFSGLGTEKIESEAARLFPNARVSRLDSDTARRKGTHEKTIKQFRAREIDILVGTQMIAKGFDFPHVTLVGVVLADTALILPDFRASEKTYQLLTQVSGRSGRGETPGRVIIQTYSPDHYSIRMTKLHDSAGFYIEEMAFRREFNYPPYLRLVNIMVRGSIEKKVIEECGEIKKTLQQVNDQQPMEIMGPAPLPFRKLRGHYRWHLMLKIGVRTQDAAFLKDALKHYKKSSHVQMAVDVDPMSIL